MLPPERVLAEMRDLGLRATELGALGYLGQEAREIRDLLAKFGLGAVGGFVPLVLHDPSQRQDTRVAAERAAELLAGAGGTYFVTAAVVDPAWSEPFELSSEGWREVVKNLALVEDVCAQYGLRQVVHPHVGTLIETVGHIQVLLEGSDVAFCLDTGHFAIGGADNVAFARKHASRVELVHLKDVDLSLAPAVINRRLSLQEATKRGLFRPLGQGNVDVTRVVSALEAEGYSGWYVFEQDTTIDEASAGTADPASQVAASIAHLRLSLAQL